MADGNRAAVHVETIVGDAEPIAAVDHLHRERFVQLPQIHVVHLRSGPLQELRDGEHRADAHLGRLAAGDGESSEHAERLQTLLRRGGVAHHHAHAGAVGELARVAGVDDAAVERRLDLRDALVGGVGADAFVLRYGDVLRRLRAARLVDDLHRRLHGDDLFVELAGGARGGGTLLAAYAVLILPLARDVVLLRDVLGRLQHRPVQLRLVRVDPRPVQHVLVHLVLDARDRFHAAGRVDVAFAGDDALRRDGDRLQARRAEAVHGHAGGRHRTSGANRDLPRDVAAGGAFRVRAAHDHVVDLGGAGR